MEIALSVSRLRQLQGILYRADINLAALLAMRLSPSSEEKSWCHQSVLQTGKGRSKAPALHFLCA
jgi:hypothetical protein